MVVVYFRFHGVDKHWYQTISNTDRVLLFVSDSTVLINTGIKLLVTNTDRVWLFVSDSTVLINTGIRLLVTQNRVWLLFISDSTVLINTGIRLLVTQIGCGCCLFQIPRC